MANLHHKNMAKKPTTTTTDNSTTQRLDRAAANVLGPATHAVAAAVKPRAASKTATEEKPRAPRKSASFSTDDVALRAYFIAEKRQQCGLPGDAHADWVEAERQLAEERQTKKKATRG